MTANAPRTIRFTEDAKTDLVWMRVTREEWALIKAEVQRVAGVRNINADSAVCRVAQCDHEWYRLKMRDPNVRIAFTVEENDSALVIRAILRRADRTYDMLEIIYQATA